jgi:DNA mismatch repair protein MutL
MNDTSTRRILLLDPQTVNQIAAGEVVERPASVVKELVENSIDAEATRIEIELKDSGSSLILVRDNGIGMSSEDLVACLDRHATSKIRRLEDLFQVQSLGFRGEAIPSIASVSHFTISSGTEDGVRHRIQVSGSKRGEVETHSGSRGTEIKVEELFFNTPARLKFLKSASTELGNCVDMVQKLAAAHPEIRISLRHADSLIFQTSGDGSLFNALTEL